ncbi:MAG: adenylyltransferase/cytidyltransferase family protein [Terriglobales bacterium]
MIFPDWQAFLPERERLRRERRVLVFANGCFDLLHPGHLHLLEQARTLGDCLLVAINSDASVHANKGPERPLIPAAERAEVLAALQFVDYALPFEEATPAQAIAAILPDVLVKGEDWGEDAIVGRDAVEAAGGKVVRLALEPGWSTTKILELVRAGRE